MKVTANRRELMFAVGLAAVMLLAVSAAAGAQSAGHMYAMATLNGEPRWRALLFPVSVDGTILASTVVLYVDHRLDRDGNTLAKWLLAIGVVISVLANVFHDWQHMAAGKLISAIGPLALFGIFHLFTQMVRSMAGVIPDKPVKQPKVAKAPAAAAPEPAAAAPRRVRIGPVRRAARVARLAGHTRPGKPAKQAVAARPVLVSVPPPPAAPKQHRKQKRRTNANVSEAEVQAYWRQNPGASLRQLNRRFGISTTTASRWRSNWMDNVTT